MPQGLIFLGTVPDFPIKAPDGSAAAPSCAFASETNTGLYRASSSLRTSILGTAVSMVSAAGFQLASSVALSWSGGAVGAASDASVRRAGAGSLVFGAADSATPLSYTLTVGESSRGGTDSDVAGGSGTIRTGLGTGTGAVTSLAFQTSVLAAAGTTAQTHATRLTLNASAATLTVPVLAKRVVAPKTASHGVNATESRTVFTNEAAAGSINFTLPSAAVGLEYVFYVDAAVALVIVAGAGDTIRLAAAVSAAAGNATSSTVGSSVTLVCVKANTWVATSIVGNWTVT